MRAGAHAHVSDYLTARGRQTDTRCARVCRVCTLHTQTEAHTGVFTWQRSVSIPVDRLPSDNRSPSPSRRVYKIITHYCLLPRAEPGVRFHTAERRRVGGCAPRLDVPSNFSRPIKRRARENAASILRSTCHSVAVFCSFLPAVPRDRSITVPAPSNRTRSESRSARNLRMLLRE